MLLLSSPIPASNVKRLHTHASAPYLIGFRRYLAVVASVAREARESSDPRVLHPAVSVLERQRGVAREYLAGGVWCATARMD
jgi:hypothetical protein